MNAVVPQKPAPAESLSDIHQEKMDQEMKAYLRALAATNPAPIQFTTNAGHINDELRLHIPALQDMEEFRNVFCGWLTQNIHPLVVHNHAQAVELSFTFAPPAQMPPAMLEPESVCLYITLDTGRNLISVSHLVAGENMPTELKIPVEHGLTILAQPRHYHYSATTMDRELGLGSGASELAVLHWANRNRDPRFVPKEDYVATLPQFRTEQRASGLHSPNIPAETMLGSGYGTQIPTTSTEAIVAKQTGAFVNSAARIATPTPGPALRPTSNLTLDSNGSAQPSGEPAPFPMERRIRDSLQPGYWEYFKREEGWQPNAPDRRGAGDWDAEWAENNTVDRRQMGRGSAVQPSVSPAPPPSATALGSSGAAQPSEEPAPFPMERRTRDALRPGYWEYIKREEGWSPYTPDRRLEGDWDAERLDNHTPERSRVVRFEEGLPANHEVEGLERHEVGRNAETGPEQGREQRQGLRVTEHPGAQPTERLAEGAVALELRPELRAFEEGARNLEAPAERAERVERGLEPAAREEALGGAPEARTERIERIKAGLEPATRNERIMLGLPSETREERIEGIQRGERVTREERIALGLPPETRTERIERIERGVESATREERLALGLTPEARTERIERVERGLEPVTREERAALGLAPEARLEQGVEAAIRGERLERGVEPQARERVEEGIAARPAEMRNEPSTEGSRAEVRETGEARQQRSEQVADVRVAAEETLRPNEGPNEARTEAQTELREREIAPEGPRTENRLTERGEERRTLQAEEGLRDRRDEPETREQIREETREEKREERFEPGRPGAERQGSEQQREETLAAEGLNPEGQPAETEEQREAQAEQQQHEERQKAMRERGHEERQQTQERGERLRHEGEENRHHTEEWQQRDQAVAFEAGHMAAERGAHLHEGLQHQREQWARDAERLAVLGHEHDKKQLEYQEKLQKEDEKRRKEYDKEIENMSHRAEEASKHEREHEAQHRYVETARLERDEKYFPPAEILRATSGPAGRIGGGLGLAATVMARSPFRKILGRGATANQEGLLGLQPKHRGPLAALANLFGWKSQLTSTPGISPSAGPTSTPTQMPSQPQPSTQEQAALQTKQQMAEAQKKKVQHKPEFPTPHMGGGDKV